MTFTITALMVEGDISKLVQIYLKIIFYVLNYFGIFSKLTHWNKKKWKKAVTVFRNARVVNQTHLQNCCYYFHQDAGKYKWAEAVAHGHQ